MRLTERDVEVLAWISRLRYLSTSLLADHFFGSSVKVARRRAKFLCDAGFLSWFSKPSFSKVGRWERIYYLNKGKSAELKALLGMDGVLFFSPSRNLLFVNHHLEVNRLLLLFKEDCNKSQKYLFDFLIEHESSVSSKRGASGLPVLGGSKAFFVPDAVVCIKNRDLQKALFFCEVDMGSQTLVSKSKLSGDVREKLTAYKDLLDRDGFKDLSEQFKYHFKGFRVLLVTVSDKRLDSLVDVCEGVDTRGMAWLTTFGLIGASSVFGKVWRVPCSGNDGLRAIVRDSKGGGA